MLRESATFIFQAVRPKFGLSECSTAYTSSASLTERRYQEGGYAATDVQDHHGHLFVTALRYYEDFNTLASKYMEWILLPVSTKSYRYTDYFDQVVIKKRSYIRREWCVRVIEAPLKVEQQENDRVRFWGYIKELEKVLRVVTLADRLTIHNVFPDRRFKQ